MPPENPPAAPDSAPLPPLDDHPTETTVAAALARAAAAAKQPGAVPTQRPRSRSRARGRDVSPAPDAGAAKAGDPVGGDAIPTFDTQPRVVPPMPRAATPPAEPTPPAERTAPLAQPTIAPLAEADVPQVAARTYLGVEPPTAVAFPATPGLQVPVQPQTSQPQRRYGIPEPTEEPSAEATPIASPAQTAQPAAEPTTTPALPALPPRAVGIPDPQTLAPAADATPVEAPVGPPVAAPVGPPVEASVGAPAKVAVVAPVAPSDDATLVLHVLAPSVAPAMPAEDHRGKHAAPEATVSAPIERMPRLLLYVGALAAAVILGLLLLVPALTGNSSAPDSAQHPSPVAATPAPTSASPSVSPTPSLASPSAAAGSYVQRYYAPRTKAASPSPTDDEDDWDDDDDSGDDGQNGDVPWWFPHR